MRRASILFASLAAALLLSSPAWAIVDIDLSAEYVTGGTVDAEIPGFMPAISDDLEGGILLKGMASILGFTGGLEMYTDSLKTGGDITEFRAKAGYGIGLPGADLSFLLTYADWEASDGGDGFTMTNLLVGVDAVLTILPVFDVEAWYNTSITSDAGITGIPSDLLDGSSWDYGIRFIYRVGFGLGITAGYRAEEYKYDLLGITPKFSNNGYTLGVDWTF